MFQQHGVLLESSLCRIIDILVMPRTIPNHPVSNLKSRYTRANLNDLACDICSHRERVLEPTECDVASFLDNPVERVDSQSMVLDDDLIGFGRWKGCRSDNQFW